MAKNSPKALPKSVDKLIAEYRKRELEIIETIVKTKATGGATEYQIRLLEKIQEILRSLTVYSVDFSRNTTEKEYEKGVSDSYKGMLAVGLTAFTFDELSTQHGRAILRKATQISEQFRQANFFVGRQIEDQLRKASLDALTKGGGTKVIKQNMIDNMVKSGINGITTIDGRTINLSAYAEMTAKTLPVQAYNDGMINNMVLSGNYYVKMSSHATSCPVCSPLQGRVYSINGTDPRFPALDVAFSGGYSSVHPNCKHQLSPYNPETSNTLGKDIAFSNRSFDIDPRSKKQIVAYDNRQKRNQKINFARQQFERYRLEIPEDTPKTFNSFWRNKESNSIKYQKLESKYRSNRLKNNQA